MLNKDTTERSLVAIPGDPSPSLPVLLSPPLVFSCPLCSQAAHALGPEDKTDVVLVAFTAKNVGSVESVSSTRPAQCTTTSLRKSAASPPAGQ